MTRKLRRPALGMALGFEYGFELGLNSIPDYGVVQGCLDQHLFALGLELAPNAPSVSKRKTRHVKA